LTLAATLFTAAISAQTPSRIATTAESLVTFPLFFHGKQIVVRHAVTDEKGLTRLVVEDSGAVRRGARSVFVVWKEGPRRSEGEIRGEFWDIGRLEEGDARFTSYDFRPILEAATQGRWPPRDQVFVILAATSVDAPLPPNPTIRAIALAPERYADRSVTVVGRFRGRNLYGDQPQPLNKGRWDFIVQSADASVWVTGMRPRGSGFDLDPGARVDTGRWLQVSGMVRREGTSVWIEATSVEAASAPEETPVEITVPPPPREPPPTVVFSAPVSDERDADRSSPVRIQFSRDMDARTFRDRVRVTYVAGTAGPAPALPPFKVGYNQGSRSLQITFAQPLERFQTVTVELLEGIAAADGQPLTPWTLIFVTGA
jgi:Bacterial Ig-like domain